MNSEPEAIQYLSTEDIDFGLNIREEGEESVGLARSIQEIGLQQPIRVVRLGSRYGVVKGARRLRAARLAKLPRIAAIVESKELSEVEVLHRQLVCDFHHEQIGPVARARAIQRLIAETGWQPSEAAGKCGLSSGTVTKLLTVLNHLPEEMLGKVNAGVIPLTSAYEIARIDDPAKQAALAQQIAQGMLTRDDLSETLKAERSGKSKKKNQKRNRVTVPIARGESVTVASPRLSLERVIEVVGDLLAKAQDAQARGLQLQAFIRGLRVEAKASPATTKGVSPCGL